MKISILVPLFNTPENFLREMLDSVLNQTYENWELIIADGSTSDVVKNVVAQYQDTRIRYIRLERNEGIAGNTNQAIALAEGDYYGLLDHDDILTEDALYEMAHAISGKIRCLPTQMRTNVTLPESGSMIRISSLILIWICCLPIIMCAILR